MNYAVKRFGLYRIAFVAGLSALALSACDGSESGDSDAGSDDRPGDAGPNAGDGGPGAADSGTDDGGLGEGDAGPGEADADAVVDEPGEGDSGTSEPDAGPDAADPDDMEACSDVECQDHARCVMSDGEAQCVCEDGFQDDGAGACADVDECAATDAPACGLNANCENIVGSFACACPAEYSGDPETFCCAPQPPTPDTASTVISRGHVDVIAVAASCEEPTEISLSTKDTTSAAGTMYRAVDKVLIHVGPNAAFTVPEGLQAGFEFLGPPGATVWLLPQGGNDAEGSGVPWAGFDAAAVSGGAFVDDELKLSLNNVEGPGRFVAFYSAQDPSSPPEPLFDVDNDLFDSTIPPGLHQHLNWFFAEPGLYVLHFSVGAARASDLTETLIYANVRVFVGDLSDLPETEPPVLVIEGFSTPYVAGDTMELSAERYGWELPFETTWLKRCDGDGGDGSWTAIDEGDTLSYVIAESDFNCHFRAAVFADGAEQTTSQPVNPTPW